MVKGPASAADVEDAATAADPTKPVLASSHCGTQRLQNLFPLCSVNLLTATRDCQLGHSLVCANRARGSSSTCFKTLVAPDGWTTAPPESPTPSAQHECLPASVPRNRRSHCQQRASVTESHSRGFLRALPNPKTHKQIQFLVLGAMGMGSTTYSVSSMSLACSLWPNDDLAIVLDVVMCSMCFAFDKLFLHRLRALGP